MAETKTTKRVVLNHILENYSNDTMVVEYAKHELELLDKKASSRTETPVQKENAEILKVIVETLTNLAKPVRISELQGANDKLKDYSNQKMSALLKKLVDNEIVVKTNDKKNTLFAIKGE